MQDILATFVPTTATTYLAHLKNFVKTAYSHIDFRILSCHSVTGILLPQFCQINSFTKD